MIKKIFISMALVFLGLAAVNHARAQTVDTIIARYLTAIGGYRKLKAVRSLRLSGTYHEGDLIANTTIEWKRPASRFVMVGDPGAAYLEGYNGTSWEYSEAQKELKLTAGTPSESVARRGAEFDESIVDGKIKGNTIKLVGRERILGKDTFRLDVILADGWSKSYYIDSETYLIAAVRKAMPLHAVGPDIESLTSYEDYRRVSGVLYPHSFVEKKIATGETMNTLKWNKIEANVRINNSDFIPPK